MMRAPLGERTFGILGDPDVNVFSPNLARDAARYAIGAAATGGALLVAMLLRWLVALPDPAMVFLTAVLVTAVTGGLGPSVLASVLGVLVYDFFFVDPVYAFAVTNPQDVVSLVTFLIAGILTSQLTARIRQHAEERSRIDVVLEETGEDRADHGGERRRSHRARSRGRSDPRERGRVRDPRDERGRSYSGRDSRT